MRVLITGASGCLGTQVSAFLDKKHDGYALARRNKVSVQNLLELDGDILQPNEFGRKLKNLDVVVHLAAVNKARTDQECERLFETNVVGTFNMLELARKMAVSRFIFASSAAVYGDKRVQPIKETFSPYPNSVYGLSKLIGERMCMYYAQTCRFSVVCLRIANMYGPYQSLGFIVPDLFDKSNRADIIEVENWSSTRDFVYVGDVAKALERCLDIDFSGVINVGSGKETTVSEIAVQLSKFLGKKVVPKRSTNTKIKRSVLDISRARHILGWEPEMPLEKGLKLTWNQMLAQTRVCR